MRNLHWFFSSLNVAMVLLFLLCMCSILGTLIPQGLETQEYLKAFPRAGFWILATGTDDLYHNTVFTVLLVLLFISALVCTSTRLGNTRRRLSSRLQLASPAEIGGLATKQELKGQIPTDSLPSPWTSKTCADGTKLFFRASGKWALIGALLIHVGLLGILLGGLIDAQLGAETMVRGSEGETSPVPGPAGVRAGAKADRLSRQARSLQGINPNDPQIAKLRGDIEALSQEYHNSLATPSFSLLFDKLEIDFHDEKAQAPSPMIKNWVSHVTVVEDGKKVASAVLRVNEPFAWGGYTFFQSDWQQKVRGIQLLAEPIPASGTVEVASKSVPIAVTAKFDSIARMPGTAYSLVIKDFWPDFRMTSDGYVSASDEMRNPAAQIEVYDDSDKLVGKAWAFSPEMSGAMKGSATDFPYTFTIVGSDPSYESGLSVTHYPGVSIVWVGCFLFSLGLCLTFYLTYLEDWIIERADGKKLLAVAGNRPPVVLHAHLEKLALELTGKTTDKNG